MSDLDETIRLQIEEAERSIQEDWPEWMRSNRDAVHVPIKGEAMTATPTPGTYVTSCPDPTVHGDEVPPAVRAKDRAESVGLRNTGMPCSCHGATIWADDSADIAYVKHAALTREVAEPSGVSGGVATEGLRAAASTLCHFAGRFSAGDTDVQRDDLQAAIDEVWRLLSTTPPAPSAGGVATEGLREAAVAVCMLWFTDNAPEGSQHVRKAMLDLRDALDALSTTPPALEATYARRVADEYSRVVLKAPVDDREPGS